MHRRPGGLYELIGLAGAVVVIRLNDSQPEAVGRLLADPDPGSTDSCSLNAKPDEGARVVRHGQHGHAPPRSHGHAAA